ncbi:MAG TPA: hypothetical protein VIY47_09655 [Ignavibacteriaceae bacterium]
MLSTHIEFQWMGIRRDSGKGSLWAWFTEVGKRKEPLFFQGDGTETPCCHVIRGKIGKKCHIEEHQLTDDFLLNVKAHSNNFRQISPEKIITRWGKSFDEELSMYLLMLKIKG